MAYIVDRAPSWSDQNYEPPPDYLYRLQLLCLCDLYTCSPLQQKWLQSRWEDHEIPGENIFLFLMFSQCMTLKRISKLQRPTVTKATYILSVSIFSKCPLYYRLTLRGRNFTSALCPALKSMSNQRSLISLSVGVSKSQ